MTESKEPSPEQLCFFTAKRFSATFRAGGRRHQIEVETPDMCACEKSMWADWGRMYTCTLGADDIVRVTYRAAETDQRATYELNVPSIAVHSPAGYDARQVTPYYLELVDAARALRVRAFMTADGTVDSVDVRPLAVGLDVASRLYGRRPESNVRNIANGSRADVSTAA